MEFIFIETQKTVKKTQKERKENTKNNLFEKNNENIFLLFLKCDF